MEDAKPKVCPKCLSERALKKSGPCAKCGLCAFCCKCSKFRADGEMGSE
jgi:hypothetical protein